MLEPARSIASPWRPRTVDMRCTHAQGERPVAGGGAARGLHPHDSAEEELPPGPPRRCGGGTARAPLAGGGTPGGGGPRAAARLRLGGAGRARQRQRGRRRRQLRRSFRVAPGQRQRAAARGRQGARRRRGGPWRRLLSAPVRPPRAAGASAAANFLAASFVGDGGAAPAPMQAQQVRGRASLGDVPSLPCVTVRSCTWGGGAWGASGWLG